MRAMFATPAGHDVVWRLFYGDFLQTGISPPIGGIVVETILDREYPPQEVPSTTM